MKKEVTLTTTEIMQGAMIGIMRQVENIKKGVKNKHGADDTWDNGINGALGEMALAKYFGVYYAGKGIMGAPDVATVDVRTRSKHWMDLLVHTAKDDSPERRFYCLTGTNGKYILHGWLLGSEAQQEKWWSDPAGNRPAFFVPKEYLHPMPTKEEGPEG